MAGEGAFITFEGGEGVGKSTQINVLKASLEAGGRPVTATREPGGSPAAEAVREIALARSAFGATAEALLMFAARRIHLDETINPARAAGRTVLCDRFQDSTEAYQAIAGDLPRAVFEKISSCVVSEDEKPSLTIILDMSFEASSERRRARGSAADRFESRSPDFHRRVRDAFLEIAAREPERCVVIDAYRGEEAVARAVRALVADRLGL